MATRIGIIQLAGCSYELACDLISQSIETNSSVVRLYGILHVTNNYVAWDSGQASVHTSGWQSIGTYYAKGDHTLITQDFTFTHDSYGNFSQYIGAGLSTTFVSGDCGGQLTLPKIDRYAIMTDAVNNPNDESTFWFKYSNPRDLTMIAWLEVNPNSEHIASRTITDGGTSGTYTWELTQQEREQLQSAMTDAKVGTIRIGISSTINNVANASYIDRTYTIINANPTYSYAYQDTNATTLAITNNNQQIIRNNSTLQINLSSMTALKYATLSTASVSIDGTTYTGTISGTACNINVGTLNLASNTNATIVVTDSRGYSTTQELPITILDWQLPTGIITLERQSNYYSETDINVDANYSSLDNKNQITLKVRYKKTTDQSYGAYVTLQDNVTSTITLDNLYSWDVQVLVQDLIGSTTYNLSVGIGLPILFIDRLKRSVGVECFPQQNNSLEINGKAVNFGTILWENSDPSSNFASQNVALNSDDYDTYEVYAITGIGNTQLVMYKGLKGYGGMLEYLSELNEGYAQYTGFRQRIFRYVDDTHLSFENALQRINTNQSTTPEVDNSKIIPIYIIGYKTGLF